MKIRQGFVTNSSSSSFVLTLKGSKHKDVIKTKEELDKYFLSEYDWEDIDTIEQLLEEPYYNNIYTAALKKIEAGSQVYFGCLATDDDITSQVSELLEVLGVEVEWRN